jgi:hypothetical protein
MVETDEIIKGAMHSYFDVKFTGSSLFFEFHLNEYYFISK